MSSIVILWHVLPSCRVRCNCQSQTFVGVRPVQQLHRCTRQIGAEHDLMIGCCRKQVLNLPQYFQAARECINFHPMVFN